MTISWASTILPYEEDYPEFWEFPQLASLKNLATDQYKFGATFVNTSSDALVNARSLYDSNCKLVKYPHRPRYIYPQNHSVL